MKGGVPDEEPMRTVMTMANDLITRKTFDGDLSETHVLDVLARHEAEVKRTIAPERLLVFDVVEGWEPLCDFLDAPVPETPFPRTNSTEEFQARLQ